MNKMYILYKQRLEISNFENHYYIHYITTYKKYYWAFFKTLFIYSFNTFIHLMHKWANERLLQNTFYDLHIYFEDGRN